MSQQNPTQPEPVPASDTIRNPLLAPTVTVPSAWPQQQTPAWTPQPYMMVMPPKKKKTGLIVLIIALVVVLLLCGGGAAYWYIMLRDDVSAPVPPGQARFPQAAVRGYLQALEAGDASAALSFAASQPKDFTLLTDAVLAANNAVNPISDITATYSPDSNSDISYVDATYQFGGQSVTMRFSAQKGNDDQSKYYFINEATSTIDASGIGSGVPTTIAGVNVSSTDSLTVFPGTYTMAVGNAMLTMTSDPTISISQPGQTVSPSVNVDLASDAQGKLQAAASYVLRSCLKETTLDTTCSLGAKIAQDENGKAINVGKVTWSVKKGSVDFTGKTLRWDPYAPTTAYASLSMRLERRIYPKNDKTGTYYYKYYDVTMVTVDFTDPDALTVAFQSDPAPM